ncbi:MAG: nucleotide exchange factor GrpE [Candidatus Competibacteraceae bacterium]
MDTDTKEQLLSRFRAYLDSVEETAVSEVETGWTDLYSLFTELAALKNEVKLESRQVKTALDEFKAVFTTLDANQTQLNDALERARTALQEQRRSLLRPLLLDLVDLRDRLEAGLQAVRNYRPSRPFWLHRREKTLLAAVEQGQDISLRRLEQLLHAQHVVPLEVLDRRLDPYTMRAADIDQRPELEDGVVTAELRKGFNWEDELLRVAEVKVNRRSEPSSLPITTDNES